MSLSGNTLAVIIGASIFTICIITAIIAQKCLFGKVTKGRDIKNKHNDS
ncbi:hypothetical protein [Alkaliphilus crotonatoxidans]